LFQSTSVDKIDCLKKGERKVSQTQKDYFFSHKKKHPTREKILNWIYFLDNDDTSKQIIKTRLIESTLRKNCEKNLQKFLNNLYKVSSLNCSLKKR
jgi:hypothetical protein